VDENGRVAEASNASSALVVDQNVCLRREMMVNYVTGVWDGGKAYRLEVPMKNARVVHIP
jgi:hypothetical protein